METTYHYRGGQSVRQNQDCGINKVIIVKKQTNFTELAKCSGQDWFANESWSTDIERIKRWAKEWAYYPERLSFEIICE